MWMDAACMVYVTYALHVCVCVCVVDIVGALQEERGEAESRGGRRRWGRLSQERVKGGRDAD